MRPEANLKIWSEGRVEDANLCGSSEQIFCNKSLRRVCDVSHDFYHLLLGRNLFLCFMVNLWFVVSLFRLLAT